MLFGCSFLKLLEFGAVSLHGLQGCSGVDLRVRAVSVFLPRWGCFRLAVLVAQRTGGLTKVSGAIAYNIM